MDLLNYRPAEVAFLKSKKVKTSELVRLTIRDLLYKNVITVNVKKTQHSKNKTHLNAFHFSIGQNFESYTPKPFELPLLKPFIQVKKGLPLPLFVTIFLDEFGGQMVKFRGSFIEHALNTGLIKRNVLNKIGIHTNSDLGNEVLDTSTNGYKDSLAPTLSIDETKDALLSYHRHIAHVELPYKQLEKIRLEIVQSLLQTLKELESNNEPGQFERVKFALTYLANPAFSFLVFTENFDQQLLAALEEEV